MTGHRILLVDDEPKVAFFFQQHLELVDEGYVTKAVNSGEAALRELKAQSYDLLITDLRMPKMDGLELLRRVRELSPQTRTILVTAYGANSVWEEAEKLDTFRALTKPLKIHDLLTAVRDALQYQQPESKTDSEAPLSTKELVVMTGDHFELLARRIEGLRVDVGARTTVLADTSGNTLAYAGAWDDLEFSSTMALLGSTMAASGELAHQLQYKQPIHLSYYEGPPYDLYAANISNNLFITIVYDRREGNNPASRIGLVWLYTRRALDELRELLGRTVSGRSQPVIEQGFASSLQGELDDMFGADDVAASVSNVAKTQESSRKPMMKTQSTINVQAKLTQVLERFTQQTNIATENQLDGLQRPLSSRKTALLLRIVGEGLKNVYHHSNATIVGISFNEDGDFLHGRLADNGVGFDLANSPVLRTLAQLQQEAESMGGQLNINGRPHYGATLSFQLPLAD